MNARKLGGLALATLVLAACSGGDLEVEVDGNVAESSEAVIGPSTPGGRNEVVWLYSLVLIDGQLYTRGCTGSYFAPRVVLTAAHCVDELYADQMFVYFGDDFLADLPQLQPGGAYWEPPPPGQPSKWAQADSVEIHPDWDPYLKYPDMAVIYLDRKLPFDPLPLYRNQVGANKQVTISGWGSNSAPTPTTGAGSGVQRTGTTKTLGSPTAADYHPDDPNPGMLDPVVRSKVLKTDGKPPYANACFGDSGGPILLSEYGQTYIAGVSYFTGLSCLDYGLWTRLNYNLPFLDNAYKKGGQEVLKPTFQCVAPNANGSLTAFFGYDNKNGVSVTVPYGTKNSLARDTKNWRPTLFEPGTHTFQFAVDFTSSQTVTWTLSPENSPTTTLTVNASSRRCGAGEALETQCGLSCRASQSSGCADLPAFDYCMLICKDIANFVETDLPACVDENAAIDACTAATPPTPASNWECYPDFGAFPTTCGDELMAFEECFYEQG